MRVSDRGVAVALAIVTAAAYALFAWGEPTEYDYYGRLASAFLQGRWWLDEAPSWLNELVPCGEFRWCVVYPPLPAVLAMPFVLVLPSDIAQGLVAQLAGGAAAGVLYLALRAFGIPRLSAVAGTILSAFGTTLFFSSVDARAWYVAHDVALLFAALAFLLAARGGPGWAVGAAIGLAALARLPVAAAAPALALLLARRSDRPYPLALRDVVLGGLPLLAAFLAYDVLRWGAPFRGYALLTVDDLYFSDGLFSPLYLPRHLYAIFMAAPDLVEGEAAFLRFRIIGMSLFLTTPAFLWIFAALGRLPRDVALRAVALAAGLALLPDVLHGTVGFAQFGYRFSLDAQPFLVALALAGDSPAGTYRRLPSTLFLVAVVLAIAMNAYATVGIVRFGLWE